MALTQIFKEFQIDLTEEPYKELLPTDTYCDRSLRRMGFVKINGRWVKKESEQQRAETQGERESPHLVGAAASPIAGEPSTHTAAPASPAPAPPPPVFDETALQRMMDTYSSRMMDQFACLRDQLSTACSRVECLQTEVRRLSDRLSALEDRGLASVDTDLRSDIRSIFEKISSLEQRVSEHTVDEVSMLAHEAARLRGVFEAGLVTVQETYQDLRDRHRDATLMFLTDIRRLTDRVEELLARPPPPPPASSSRPPFRL